MTGISHIEMIFESSGTTGKSKSRHHVADPEIYKESLIRTFRLFYGDPSEYFIAALLPSYTERKNSSLVFMVNELIEKSAYPCSGCFRDNIEDLLINIGARMSIGNGLLIMLRGILNLKGMSII